MDDSLFGPWKLDPPINKWHEFKIGKLDAWYQVSANSLQPVTSDKSSDPDFAASKILMIV